jgi:hypothetical protein
MSDVLDYGRRRSRRHWRVVAVGVVLAAGALFAVRAWREHLARLEDRRLMLQQQTYRQQFDRELQKSLGPAPGPAATQP